MNFCHPSQRHQAAVPCLVLAVRVSSCTLDGAVQEYLLHSIEFLLYKMHLLTFQWLTIPRASVKAAFFTQSWLPPHHFLNLFNILNHRETYVPL